MTEPSESVDGRRCRSTPGPDGRPRALWRPGSASWRTTRVGGRPRGLFCGIGVCFDCLITVDGRPPNAPASPGHARAPGCRRTTPVIHEPAVRRPASVTGQRPMRDRYDVAGGRWRARPGWRRPPTAALGGARVGAARRRRPRPGGQFWRHRAGEPARTGQPGLAGSSAGSSIVEERVEPRARRTGVVRRREDGGIYRSLQTRRRGASWRSAPRSCCRHRGATTGRCRSPAGTCPAWSRPAAAQALLKGIRRRWSAGGSSWPGPGRSCCRSRSGWPRPGPRWSGCRGRPARRVPGAGPAPLLGRGRASSARRPVRGGAGPAPGPVPDRPRGGRGPRRARAGGGTVSGVDSDRSARAGRREPWSRATRSRSATASPPTWTWPSLLGCGTRRTRRRRPGRCAVRRRPGPRCPASTRPARSPASAARRWPWSRARSPVGGGAAAAALSAPDAGSCGGGGTGCAAFADAMHARPPGAGRLAALAGRRHAGVPVRGGAAGARRARPCRSWAPPTPGP